MVLFHSFHPDCNSQHNFNVIVLKSKKTEWKVRIVRRHLHGIRNSLRSWMLMEGFRYVIRSTLLCTTWIMSMDKCKWNSCSSLCHERRKFVDFTIVKIGHTVHKILLTSVALEFTNILVVECSFAIRVEEGNQNFNCWLVTF